MPVRPNRLLGDPSLWKPSAPIENPHDFAALVIDLRDTLADFRQRSGFGRGISAPQIGQSVRVLYIHIPGHFDGPLFNPQIIARSEDQFTLWDDCFSFPNLLVHVSRARQITVRYQNEEREQQTLHAQDALSELLQHEIDHLDGILAIERATSSKAFCVRAEWEQRHQNH